MVTPKWSYWNSVFRLVFQHVCHASQTVENLHLSPSSPDYLPRPQRQELGRATTNSGMIWHLKKAKLIKIVRFQGRSCRHLWTCVEQLSERLVMDMICQLQENMKHVPRFPSSEAQTREKWWNMYHLRIIPRYEVFDAGARDCSGGSDRFHGHLTKRNGRFTGVHRFTCKTCLHRRRSLHCWHVGDEFLMLKM